MCGISRVAGCGGGWGRDSFGSMSGGPPARALECARPTPNGSRIPCGTQPTKVSASVHQRAITNRSRRTLTHVTAKNARTTSKMSLRTRLTTRRNCRSSGHRQRKPPAYGGFRVRPKAASGPHVACVSHSSRAKRRLTALDINGDGHQWPWRPRSATHPPPKRPNVVKPTQYDSVGRARRATSRTGKSPSGTFYGGIVAILRSPVRAARSAPDAIHRT